MPRPLLILVLLLALVVGTPAPSIAQSDSEQIRIDEIAVSGNRRVAVGTVLSYLPVRVGDRVTRSSLSIALERLYETELFADIQIDIDGETLRIDVVENPIINRVNIEGNDALDDEKLLEIVDIQPRRVYTRRLAVEASQKLLQVYQAAGRYAAVVEPQIIELEDNRVDLAFVVK